MFDNIRNISMNERTFVPTRSLINGGSLRLGKNQENCLPGFFREIQTASLVLITVSQPLSLRETQEFYEKHKTPRRLRRKHCKSLTCCTTQELFRTSRNCYFINRRVTRNQHDLIPYRINIVIHFHRILCFINFLQIVL